MPILGLACFVLLMRDGSFVVTGKMSFMCVDPGGVELIQM